MVAGGPPKQQLTTCDVEGNELRPEERGWPWLVWPWLAARLLVDSGGRSFFLPFSTSAP